MTPTLMVLAAGMGSRYGGLKQVDAVGPSGKAILAADGLIQEPFAAINAARYLDDPSQPHPLTGNELVSMNMFGFTPSVFGHLRANIQNEKSEFYIPTPVNHLIRAGKARMKVLESQSAWFGITYREDKPTVVANIRALIAKGQYPESLWG